MYWCLKRLKQMVKLKCVHCEMEKETNEMSPITMGGQICLVCEEALIENLEKNTQTVNRHNAF